MSLQPCENTGNAIAVKGFENTITLIRSVVITYRAETWPIRKSDERKILRKIHVIDSPSGEILFHSVLRSILENDKEQKITMGSGHRRKPILRIALKENPTGLGPLGRPRSRRDDDVVRKDAEALRRGVDVG